MFKNWTRHDWFCFICNNFLVIIGSFILAIGTGIFLSKLSIVAGGLSGIGIIVQHYVSFQILDIIVWIGTAILWVVGFFTIGKEFSFRTLLSSVAYPGFLTLVLRVNYFQNIAEQVAGDGGPGNILICGLFAGVFIGAGVALTFLGKGSTGGVDTLVFLFAKKTKIKESVWSFIIDGSIIVLSMILVPNQWINSLVGILSAFITAMMIEFIYNANLSSYQVDVISDKWEDISRFAQDVMGRGATIIKAQGGFHQEERTILRVVFDRRQFDTFKKFVAKTDPKAFITYTQTNAVYGEGFKSIVKKKKEKK